ncbi:hypothetical protein Tco_0942314 [Tanacetum coccineum]
MIRPNYLWRVAAQQIIALWAYDNLGLVVCEIDPITMANLPPNYDANALVPKFNNEFMPNLGHAHFANNNNNNGWIEWDVPLGEMDEPMVDPELSDIEATNSLALGDSTLENCFIGANQCRACRPHYSEPGRRTQQLQTTVAEMHSREYLGCSTWLCMEERLHCYGERDFQDRPPGAQIMAPKQMPASCHFQASFSIKCRKHLPLIEGPPEEHDRCWSIWQRGSVQKRMYIWDQGEFAEEGTNFNFAACVPLQGRALTWWNTQVCHPRFSRANGKSWDDMKKMMLKNSVFKEKYQDWNMS